MFAQKLEGVNYEYVHKIINNVVHQQRKFSVGMQLSLGDNRFEELSEVWRGPIWAVYCYVLSEVVVVVVGWGEVKPGDSKKKSMTCYCMTNGQQLY